MAIKTFKEILDNKGYRISSKDRAIFEQGNLQSFFGFSDNDFIEFIIYDVNDNQLPQGESGELVRYIKLSTESINDYIMIPEGTLFQSFNFPSEYFIDVERLLREAGYDNGIFKTQISLLNKRVGFESKYEKLWIKEISPSRTEVKLLPLRNETSDKTDLLKRFNIMFSGAEFRDDLLQFIPEFVEKIDSSIIDSYVKNTYSSKFYNRLVKEFSIKGFDTLTTKMYNKFIEAVKYEFLNRESRITNPNYGKPKATKPILQISESDLAGLFERILVDCVNFYLPMRAIQSKTEYDETLDNSFDKVGEIMQRKSSDVRIAADEPIVKRKIVKQELLEVTELEVKITKEIPVNVPVPVFVEAAPPKPAPKPKPPKVTPPPIPYIAPQPVVPPPPPPPLPKPPIPRPKPIYPELTEIKVPPKPALPPTPPPPPPIPPKPKPKPVIITPPKPVPVQRGGGSVLYDENIPASLQNGRVVGLNPSKKERLL
jgi:hypothetical protein